jgi:hypothetical protein
MCSRNAIPTCVPSKFLHEFFEQTVREEWGSICLKGTSPKFLVKYHLNVVKDERPDNMVSIPDGAQKTAAILPQENRDSSVRWARGWGAGVQFAAQKRFFYTPLRQERLYDPPSSLSYRRGVKRKWREADHSPRSYAEVKNGELYLHSNIHFHFSELN